eukprot:CAMPEP_0185799546 /NCGR_PEP_ID=MMETSP1322-20130828/381_1 /TAXON_ID=265543 /ORGANISM="Minutocellus polymorphus, Strain RCC2270" /LENGTH=247 /DNA_ID=CAMNT_0028495125 /DNA_START=8 /DNA_END=751 /DNA_ORIENTATION=+
MLTDKRARGQLTSLLVGVALCGAVYLSRSDSIPLGSGVDADIAGLRSNSRRISTHPDDIDPMLHHQMTTRHLRNKNNNVYEECLDLDASTCLTTLESLCASDPSRFPNLSTGCNTLTAVTTHLRDTTSPNYNTVGIIPDPTNTYAVGADGSCRQFYELPWTVGGVETDLGPFDCADPNGAEGACLPLSQCCDVITGSGTPVDDQGNSIACYYFPVNEAYENANPKKAEIVIDKKTGKVKSARIFYAE